jgi:hypothetical protein
MITNFFSPLSFVTVFESRIRDPRSGIRSQDPGSGINIPDHTEKNLEIYVLKCCMFFFEG